MKKNFKIRVALALALVIVLLGAVLLVGKNVGIKAEKISNGAYRQKNFTADEEEALGGAYQAVLAMKGLVDAADEVDARVMRLKRFFQRRIEMLEGQRRVWLQWCGDMIATCFQGTRNYSRVYTSDELEIKNLRQKLAILKRIGDPPDGSLHLLRKELNKKAGEVDWVKVASLISSVWKEIRPLKKPDLHNPPHLQDVFLAEQAGTVTFWAAVTAFTGGADLLLGGGEAAGGEIAGRLTVRQLLKRMGASATFMALLVGGESIIENVDAYRSGEETLGGAAMNIAFNMAAGAAVGAVIPPVVAGTSITSEKLVGWLARRIRGYIPEVGEMVKIRNNQGNFVDGWQVEKIIPERKRVLVVMTGEKGNPVRREVPLVGLMRSGMPAFDEQLFIETADELANLEQKVGNIKAAANQLKYNLEKGAKDVNERLNELQNQREDLRAQIRNLKDILREGADEMKECEPVVKGLEKRESMLREVNEQIEKLKKKRARIEEGEEIDKAAERRKSWEKRLKEREQELRELEARLKSELHKGEEIYLEEGQPWWVYDYDSDKGYLVISQPPNAPGENAIISRRISEAELKKALAFKLGLKRFKLPKGSRVTVRRSNGDIEHDWTIKSRNPVTDEYIVMKYDKKGLRLEKIIPRKELEELNGFGSGGQAGAGQNTLNNPAYKKLEAKESNIDDGLGKLQMISDAELFVKIQELERQISLGEYAEITRGFELRMRVESLLDKIESKQREYGRLAMEKRGFMNQRLSMIEDPGAFKLEAMKEFNSAMRLVKSFGSLSRRIQEKIDVLLAKAELSPNEESLLSLLEERKSFADLARLAWQNDVKAVDSLIKERTGNSILEEAARGEYGDFIPPDEAQEILDLW